MVTSSLARSAAHGARDLVVAQAVKFSVYLGGLVILSRLLSPADFGIVAVGTTFIGFAEVLRDFGLSVAAVRERTLTNDVRDALFWSSSALGVVFAIALVALSAPLASVFGMPALAGVLASLSIVFIINGFGAQHRAGLTRDRHYRSLAIADASSAVLGLVSACIAAVIGAQYWSLVIQAVVSATVGVIVVFGAARWAPGRPRRASGIRRMYAFGANYALAQVLGYAGNGIATVALGLVGGASSAGLYSRGLQLSIGVLDQVKAPALTVALPSLTHVRDDPQRLHAALLRGQVILGYVTVPIAAIMFAAATPAVMLIMGGQWDAAAPVVAVLAIAGALQQVATAASWLFVTSGNGRALRDYTVVSTTLKVAFVVALAPHGPIGAAIGFTAAVCLAWPVAIIWATRVGGLPPLPLLVQGSRILAPGIVAAAAGWAVLSTLTAALPIAQIAVAVLVVATVYGVSAVFPPVRNDLKQVVTTIRLAVTPLAKKEP